MHAGKSPSGLVTSKKLEYRCSKVYQLPPGIGYIGSKYVYKHMSDLIGRSTFIKVNTQSYTYRLVKCVGQDLERGSERAIFQDKLGKHYLNPDNLQQLGYSRILPQ